MSRARERGSRLQVREAGRSIVKGSQFRALYAHPACWAIVFLMLAPLPSHALDLDDVSPLAGPGRAFNPFPMAAVAHASAPVVNPAGLAAATSSDFLFLYTDADEIRDGDMALLLKMRTLGVAYERFNPLAGRDDVSRLTVGLGHQITRSLAVGASYAWFFSEDDGLADMSSLDFGLRARVAPRVVLAGAAYGFNSPDLDGVTIPREYMAGARMAPITKWLGLFVEGTMTAEQSLGDATGAYGTEIEPLNGLVLRGRADTDGDFHVGLEFNYNQTAYGILGRYSHGGGSDGRAGYMRLVDVPYARGAR
jgi:hypothetical protein